MSTNDSLSNIYFPQKKKEGQHMVSVGIQNEARLHGAPLPKKKPKTKTMILMDAAIQTGTYHEQGSNKRLENNKNVEDSAGI